MEKLTWREKYSYEDGVFDWSWISKEYELPEDFIREHADQVDWYWISCKQKLGANFIREFADRINWRNLVLSTNWSDEFRGRVK